MEDAFSIFTHEGEGFRVVVVRGELDELTTPDLDEAIDADDLPAIVDLSNIVFISSAGINALLRDRPARTTLVCPPGNVLRLFEIVRANHRVPIFETLEDAIESVTPRVTPRVHVLAGASPAVIS
jgi:anti-anti-sigma factor